MDKYFFGKTGMEYLGFLVTRNDVYSQIKIQAIKNTKPLTFCKEVRHFIGAVNYYLDIWARLSHNFVPLTNITRSKVKFKWTKFEQNAFDEIKQIVSHDIL